jgi:hypothetical protein
MAHWADPLKDWGDVLVKQGNAKDALAKYDEALKYAVHLRLCGTCGHVGCCDDSKNRHATKHFQATQHPIMTSIEPGEHWSWCYIDELVMELPS